MLVLKQDIALSHVFGTFCIKISTRLKALECASLREPITDIIIDDAMGNGPDKST